MTTRIHAALIEKAQSVFSTLSLPTGCYTSPQVDEAIPKLSADELARLKNQEITISVGDFKATTTGENIFRTLSIFETTHRIASKKRARFNTCTEHENSNVVLSVDFTLTKEMRDIHRFTSTDKFRPAICGVHIDHEVSRLVASDGVILASYYIPDLTYKLLEQDAPTIHTIIPSSIFKKIPLGRVSIQQVKNLKEKTIDTLILASDGYSQCVSGLTIPLKFPNWKSVISHQLLADCTIRLTPSSLDLFRRELKTILRDKSIEGIYLTNAATPSNQIKLDIYDPYFNYDHEMSPLPKCIKSVILDLLQPIPPVTCHLCPTRLSWIPKSWDGTIHFNEAKPAHTLFTLSSPYNDYILLMQRMSPDYYPNLSTPNCTTIPFDPIAPSISSTPSISSKPSISQPFVYIMSTSPTAKFYSIQAIEAGHYRISDHTSDPSLRLFLRTAAHFYICHPEHQASLCSHFNNAFTHSDWKAAYPLTEEHLANLIGAHLTSMGIDEIPDYQPAIDEHLASFPSTTTEVKDNDKDNDEPPTCAIIPILQLETTEGTLTIAGESYFDQLYDVTTDTFRSPQSEEKFNEIDAFIPDHLVLSSSPDEDAIIAAVEKYFSLVDSV